MNDAINSNDNPNNNVKICDKDGICESVYGETYESCPSDCPEIMISENT